MNALETGVFSIDRGQVMHERAVASHAIVLQDFRPPLGNKDRFMEILKRKPLRMADVYKRQTAITPWESFPCKSSTKELILPSHARRIFFQRGSLSGAMAIVMR